MEYECQFDMVMDLLKDAFKWKMKAREMEYQEDESKFLKISAMLYEMFEKEYADLIETYKKA